ncbi:histidine kinase [Legionella lytica]|uniref:Histidine kinase n=1 Tax=Legionella lytica TaxID=96232 RepID=A0ABW8D761_9GAMM
MNGLMQKNLYTQLLLKFIHELNQPLTVIKAYLGGCEIKLQRNELSPSQMNSVLQKINEHTELFKDKIYSMQQLIVQEEGVNISSIITEITSLFFLEIKHHHIQLTLDFHESLPDFNMQKSQLKCVLFRLLKQCIDSVEKNDIKQSELLIQTKPHQQNILSVTITSNFPIKEESVEQELTYCRTLFTTDCGRLLTESVPNGICFQLLMFHKDPQDVY